MLNGEQADSDDDHGTRITPLVSRLTSWLGSFPAIVFAPLIVLAWLVGGLLGRYV